MTNSTLTKQAVLRQLRGLDKESHSRPLAESILRSCKDDGSVIDRVHLANSVVSRLRGAGVSSFFAAEYAKIYTDPEMAVSIRQKLADDFKAWHDLSPKQAAKLIDCVVFSAAKKGGEKVERMAALANAALAAGVHFNVVADVVYYNSPEIEPLQFAARCETTSAKLNKPMDVAAGRLVSRLTSAVNGL